MRIAIVSDIHGNLTAFEAVLADLRDTSPDLVLHGGDLADAGTSPAEVVDLVQSLGWQGVAGNGEEALTTPATLDEFARQSSAPPALWSAVREMMASTRQLLGDARLAWLRSLPRLQTLDAVALVHASPDSVWRAPGPEESDAGLSAVYASLGRSIVVYGHIHRAFLRHVPRPEESSMLVANAGSVSLSYDGDPRAAYLLLDDSQPTIRRVGYDLEKEVRQLSTSSLPHAGWLAKTLRAAVPQLP